jgi:hypothetical protein
MVYHDAIASWAMAGSSKADLFMLHQRRVGAIMQATSAFIGTERSDGSLTVVSLLAG